MCGVQHVPYGMWWSDRNAHLVHRQRAQLTRANCRRGSFHALYVRHAMCMTKWLYSASDVVQNGLASKTQLHLWLVSCIARLPCNVTNSWRFASSVVHEGLLLTATIANCRRYLCRATCVAMNAYLGHMLRRRAWPTRANCKRGLCLALRAGWPLFTTAPPWRGTRCVRAFVLMNVHVYLPMAVCMCTCLFVVGAGAGTCVCVCVCVWIYVWYSSTLVTAAAVSNFMLLFLTLRLASAKAFFPPSCLAEGLDAFSNKHSCWQRIWMNWKDGSSIKYVKIGAKGWGT